MKTKKPLKLLMLTLAAAAVSTPVRALPDYMKIFAADPFSRTELRAKCSVCHINETGGGDRNAFGRAFAAAGHKINADLRQQFPDRFTGIGSQVPEVVFPTGSQDEAIIEIGGTKYLINTRNRTVTPATGQAIQAKPREAAPSLPEDIFLPVDVRLVNLPTAVSIPKGSLWIDFTHRFPFSEVTDRAQLLGLDTFAIPSFGVTYGITDQVHVGAYRAPTAIGRPIELFVGATLLEERKGHPFNLMGRVALEGRDNFQRNFATTFEVALARSITRHAQVFFVPSVTIGDRPLAISPSQNYPGRTAPALGIGAAVRVLPSVTLMAEVNMRLTEESRYSESSKIEYGFGIHRPAVGFALEKASKSRRHSFTLTFTNGPGTTLSQRSMTRGLLFSDDSFAGMSIGFNLTRRFF